MARVYPHGMRVAAGAGAQGGRVIGNRVSLPSCQIVGDLVYWGRFTVSGARSSMDRVLPSEGRGCWFDPSRARQA